MYILTRANSGSPRRHKRRHHSRIEDYVIENFIADWQKQKVEAEEKKKKEKDVAQPAKVSAAGLGMLLFLLTPVLGPIQIYFTISMLSSSLELLKSLPFK